MSVFFPCTGGGEKGVGGRLLFVREYVGSNDSDSDGCRW